MEFQDKIAFVTGGGSGIGAACARRFASGGAHVVVADVVGDGAKSVAAALDAEGLRGESVVLDITDAAALEAAVGEIVARHGGIDHVVSCAGVATRHTLAQMPVDAWRRVIDVNLTGAFMVLKFTQSAIEARGGGSVAVISSIAAEHIAYMSGAHYAASKSALTGLVRHAAFELGRRNIRVNAVGPGPMSNRMGGGRVDLDQQKTMARNLPLQRVVEPEDIANVCAFLASPAARAVTGVYLPVDNGFLTGHGVRYQQYFEAHGEAL